VESVFYIKFWGVRGMIPRPGSSFEKVGGRTACVEVGCGSEVLIFDCGSGARALGKHLMRNRTYECRLFLSHFHWDHIIGVPFFEPFRHRDVKVDIFGPPGGRELLERSLSATVMDRNTISRLDELEASTRYHDMKRGTTVSCGEAVVSGARLNHPGGVWAYRVDFGGHAVVYATDTEHYSCPDRVLLSLAEGADVLIYDATYTPEEYEGKRGKRSAVGLGHSTYEEGAKLALDAGVRHLVLFHHHPDRDDDEVSAVEDLCRNTFSETTAARERMTIELL
jgi:phosphoribosyl 1,2-cyclic phosphodiesterase